MRKHGRKKSFGRLLLRQFAVFVTIGAVGLVFFFLTGHPVATVTLTEKVVEWLGLSASAAMTEAHIE